MSKEKLVRDKMPELCETTPGWTKMNYRIARPVEMQGFLSEKLKEEALEAAQLMQDFRLQPTAGRRSKLIEELADLEEVLSTIRELMYIHPDEVEEAREKKKEQRGGLERGVIWDGNK